MAPRPVGTLVLVGEAAEVAVGSVIEVDPLTIVDSFAWSPHVVVAVIRVVYPIADASCTAGKHYHCAGEEKRKQNFFHSETSHGVNRAIP